MKKLLTSAITLTFLTVSAPAFCWGPAGHAIVARIARSHLTPDTLKRVQQILSIEPGANMVNVASWADKVRTRGTEPWHFVNFPRGNCHYVEPIECAKGQCLVDALSREEAILVNPASTPQERDVALKYVIHLAGGDSSQPFHSGMKSDRGGNKYQVYFDGRGSNVHRLWDSGLIDHFDAYSSAYVNQLIQLSNDPRANDHDLNPVDWVEHSCKIAQSSWIYPPHNVPDSYATRAQPVLDSQLIRGGLHLADTLNHLLP